MAAEEGDVRQSQMHVCVRECHLCFLSGKLSVGKLVSLMDIVWVGNNSFLSWGN